MAGTVSQYQQGAFASPTNGTIADATVVLSNDNTIRGKHNSHDADPTIHVQSSALASRPAAGTAQRVWVTTDGLRAYVDSGAAWGELAYLPIAGGTVTGATTFSAGVTFSAAITYGGVTLSNAVTGTGNMVLSAGPTFTGTAAFATVTTSSTINGQTISSAAAYTGTMTIIGTLALANATTSGAASGSVVLRNATSVYGTNAANNDTYQLIGVTAGNLVSIDAAARSVTFGGGISATTGTFSNDVTVSAGHLVLNGNYGGGTNIATAGAADSGGAGFRLLRVPN